MKSISFLTAGLLAVTSFLAAPMATHAAVTGQQGDLVLAFRTNDDSLLYNLEIDLGQASNFSNLAAGTVLNLAYGTGNYFSTNGGLVAGDLVKVFGSNWNTNTGLVFSVAGADTSNNLYATFGSGIVPNRNATGAQTGAKNTISKVVTGLVGSDSVFDNGSTTVALTSPQAAAFPSTDTNSYSDVLVNANSKDYGYFSNSTEAGVPSSGSSFLNLYKMAPGSATLPGQLLGTFNLTSAGGLTFTAAPEPGSVALLGVSAMTLLFRRRRAAQA